MPLAFEQHSSSPKWLENKIIFTEMYVPTHGLNTGRFFIKDLRDFKVNGDARLITVGTAFSTDAMRHDGEGGTFFAF